MIVSPPNDTHANIEALLIEGYRKMSPSQKLERVCALTQAVQQLALMVVMSSDRVVRHAAEQPSRTVATVQPHRQANAQLIGVRLGMATTDASERKLADRLAQPHRRFQPPFRGHAPQQLVVPRIGLRRGVGGRHTTRA